MRLRHPKIKACLRILLKHKADRTIKSNQDLTSLDLAKNQKLDKLVEILQP